jgi:hypothetical protein
MKRRTAKAILAASAVAAAAALGALAPAPAAQADSQSEWDAVLWTACKGLDNYSTTNNYSIGSGQIRVVRYLSAPSVVVCRFYDSAGTIGYQSIVDLDNGGDFNFGMSGTSTPAAPSSSREFLRKSMLDWWGQYKAGNPRTFSLGNASFFNTNDAFGGNTTLSFSAKRGGVLQTIGSPSAGDLSYVRKIYGRESGSNPGCDSKNAPSTRSETAMNSAYAPYDRAIESFRFGSDGTPAFPIENRRVWAGCGVLIYYGPEATACQSNTTPGSHELAYFVTTSREVVGDTAGLVVEGAELVASNQPVIKRPVPVTINLMSR